MKALIIYWSGTGNTEKVAKAIRRGSDKKGIKPIVKRIEEAKGDICIFAHIESFGVKTPIIGTIVDLLLKLLYHSVFDIVKRDMIEDGKRLKETLEEN